MVEIGCVDIILDVSKLSLHLAMPREGHLKAVFHMFAYLEKKHNAQIVFDPTYSELDMSVFKECDWKEFYGNITEAIPPNAPKSRNRPTFVL